MKIADIKNKYVSENRKNATIYERLMSMKLKVAKIKFIHQHVIDYDDSFIICDFYIPKYNLIIEIDGLYHDSILQTHKDSLRDKYLQTNGYVVFRMWNNEVDSFDTNTIKNLPIYEQTKKKSVKKAVKAKYTLAKKAEDKKKLTTKQFNAKYKRNGTSFA